MLLVTVRCLESLEINSALNTFTFTLQAVNVYLVFLSLLCMICSCHYCADIAMPFKCRNVVDVDVVQDQ